MGTYLRLVLLLFFFGGLIITTSEARAVEKRDNAKTVSKRAVVRQPTKKARPIAKKEANLVKPANPAPSQPISDKLNLKSGAALVLEQQTSKALFQKNADQVMPIASLTKLMTAMVVLDGAPDLQAPITITDDDVDYLKGSSSRLPVGSIISRETALLLALMSSENRAASALGRHYPGGMPSFVAAMNKKARSLGMADSHFADPTGLTSKNVSTAHDLARMVAAAHGYPLIRRLTTNGESTVNIDGRELLYRNTNPLVRNPSWDVGLSKTGYISEAGKCLVMQAYLAEKPVLIVLLDSVGSLTRVGDANRIKRWLEGRPAAGKPPIHTVSTRSGQKTTG